MTTLSQPVFKTERLVVFRQDVVISEILIAERAMFTAFLHSEDTPRIVCTMLITTDMVALGGMYLDWISTDPDFRRKGYAYEMWRGVEKYFNSHLIADGASDEGEALCTKIEGAA